MRSMLRVSMSVVGALAIGAGCSSDTTASHGAALYSPCAEGTQVGRFNLWVSAADADTGTAGFVGLVVDHREVSDFQRAVADGGACTLMERDPGTPCAPACAGDTACYADGTCAPYPVAHSVGTVTLAGLQLGRSSSFEPSTGGTIAYAASAGDLPYPPAAPGAAVTLDTSGGDYTPFTLAGRGVTPLLPRAGALAIARGQPLTIEWAAPRSSEGTLLIAYVSLGGADSTGAGGVPGAGHIVCRFPDTGTGTVSASLIGGLIDGGVGAAPILNLQRTTVSSTQIAHGCVDFSVVTQASQPIVVNP